MKRISLAGVALAIVLNGNPADAATLRVADFGAKGDGRSDDTAALQRALNAVGTGYELHFDAGKTYIISSSLQMRNRTGYTVVGNGATIRASSSLPANSRANSYMILIWDNYDYAWKDISFDGNRHGRSGPAVESGDQGWYHNIIIRGGADFVFDRVRSNYSYQDGFYLHGLTPSNPATFPRRGTFLNSIALYNFRQGLSIINAYDIKVLGGSYSYTEGDWPMAGIQIEPDPSGAWPGAKNILIKDVMFWGNKGFGVGACCAAPDNITIETSYFGDNARGGVSIGGTNMTVRNNAFEWFYRQITYKGYGRLNTETRAIVDIPVGENGNARVHGNIFRYIGKVGQAVIYIHSHAKNGIDIRDNCFQSTDMWPIVDFKRGSGVTIGANSENPPNGCPSNRAVIGW